MQREAYSPAEFQEMTGLSKPSIKRRIAEGKIPTIRIGSRLLIPRQFVDRLFADAGWPRETIDA